MGIYRIEIRSAGCDLLFAGDFAGSHFPAADETFGRSRIVFCKTGYGNMDYHDPDDICFGVHGSDRFVAYEKRRPRDGCGTICTDYPAFIFRCTFYTGWNGGTRFQATLEKFIDHGWLQKVTDIFSLSQYKEEIQNLDGFGEKSYTNLIQAIEDSKQVTLERVIYSLGIKGIGLSMAKLICRKYPLSLNEYKNLSVKELLSVDGIGEKLAESFVEYFTDSENQDLLQQLSNILTIALPEKIESNASFEGKTFVITGSLTHFTNRNECKEKIESLGGKVSSFVSKNTAFLVNNDITSSSSKNKKAKELGVPIITEDELLEMIQ